jgi:hydroxypyruvate isomerase
MRFCANISVLFTEVPLLKRFAAARSAGLSAVELWWPRGEDLDAVAEAAAGTEVVLLNFDAGDMPAGDRGLASDPARRDEFRANVPVALDLADRIGATRLNALLGFGDLDLARENVRYAADAAAEHGADVMIEAVNTFENGPYLVHTTRAAAEFIRSVGRDNVRLQYDAYHMQRMEGNLTATIAEHLELIGHIQIADSPGRGEPGTGEIDYEYVLRRIDELGYAGWVGLEYKPTRSTVESLDWMVTA